MKTLKRKKRFIYVIINIFCYFHNAFTLTRKIYFMENIEDSSILFVGNRAKSIYENLGLSAQEAFSAFTFESSNPFSEEKNKIYFNDIEFKTSVDYNLDDLKIKCIQLMDANQIPQKLKLIIGDPSELLYQAYSLANLELNKETRLFEEQPMHLWFYPMGMTSLDIRKELALLIYFLKKHDSQVLMLRNKQEELNENVNQIISKIAYCSIYDLQNEMNGLEHLIGKPSEYLVNG